MGGEIMNDDPKEESTGDVHDPRGECEDAVSNVHSKETKIKKTMA